MKICILKTGYKCLCGVQTGKDINACLNRISTNHETVFLMFHTLWRCINNNIDLMSQNKVHKVRRRLFQFVSTDRLDSIFFEDSCCASCCINTVSKCLKTPCDRNNFLLIFIFDSDDHVLILRQTNSSSKECFVKSLIEGLCNTKALTGGFHFRSELDFNKSQLGEREYRCFNGYIAFVRHESERKPCILQGFTKSDSCCIFNHVDAGNLAHEWNRTAGSRIDFNDIDLAIDYDELDIDEALDVHGSCNSSCVIGQCFNDFLREMLRRINGNGVAGMNAGTFNLFHDARDADIDAIGNGIDFHFTADHVLVDQDRMLMGHLTYPLAIAKESVV